MSNLLRQQYRKIDNKNYEVLPEDYSSYDLSFKIIVIGNSGNYKIIIIFNQKLII